MTWHIISVFNRTKEIIYVPDNSLCVSLTIKIATQNACEDRIEKGETAAGSEQLRVETPRQSVDGTEVKWGDNVRKSG